MKQNRNKQKTNHTHTQRGKQASNITNNINTRINI